MPPEENFRNIISNKPALLAPPNVEANFADPTTIRSGVLGIMISMSLLATLAVAVRMYTKLLVVKRLVLEDCKRAMIIFSLNAG